MHPCDGLFLHRWYLAPALLAMLGLILACTSLSPSLVASFSPAWACPSPTPRPYGADGPVKAWEPCNCRVDPLTGARRCDECPTFFAIWEQEYGQAGGPPFPSPTPYVIQGTTFVFGQRVRMGPIFAQVEAQPGPPVAARAGSPLQPYTVRISLINQAPSALPIDYRTQVAIRAIQAGGRVLTDRWGVSDESLRLAETTLPATIPPGASMVSIPILAPPGTPHIVELLMLADGSRLPPLPSATVPPGTPTPTAAPPTEPAGTPTPNTHLALAQGQFLTVQWTNTALAPQLPPCDSPGATTDWSVDDPLAAHGRPVAPAIAAPPGSARVVQVALNQVGKPYIFGAKGPEQFDCSGLLTWSYAQIGISIPQGTAGQWPQLRPVAAGQLQPGDLIFFTLGRLGQRVDHVGMLVGDLNGNGQWDMVHAANEDLGVRVDYDIFDSRYYGAKIAGFRTVR